MEHPVCNLMLIAAYCAVLVSGLRSIAEISCEHLLSPSRFLERAGLFVYMQVERFGTECTLLPRFFRAKDGNERKKEAVVWSGSSRISCLQGVPSEKGTKGNALKRKRERERGL